MNYLKCLALALVLNLSWGAQARAEETKPIGRTIMEKVYNRPVGNDMTARLTMTLRNRHGEERVRQIRQFSSVQGSTEKKIMFFEVPADVRNTSFMSWSYDNGDDDDQWIYLPALRRVKRISSDSKSDYFMGSDFTYDDLGDRHPDKDYHRLVKKESLKGKDVYVVESTPKDENYMYSKTLSWVLKDESIGLKREFYDKHGKLLKTLTVNKYGKISGVWVVQESLMNNVQKGHQTVMHLDDVSINSGVPASRFSERMMQRGL
jgi:outer membrane lipoprotein-sorting protein